MTIIFEEMRVLSQRQTEAAYNQLSFSLKITFDLTFWLKKHSAICLFGWRNFFSGSKTLIMVNL